MIGMQFVVGQEIFPLVGGVCVYACHMLKLYVVAWSVEGCGGGEGHKVNSKIIGGRINIS